MISPPTPAATNTRASTDFLREGAPETVGMVTILPSHLMR
jgi:hypothetical protein